MKLVLTVQKRGRGRPRNDVRLACARLKLGAEAETQILAQEAASAITERKPKREAETVIAAEKVGRGRSTGYAARRILRRAKELNK